MIGFVLFVAAIVTLIAVVANPKLGAVLVWPIIYLYPHLYMSRLDLIPWNIGVDDAFICCFFVAVVIRRNLFAGVGIRLGVSVLGAFAYFVIWGVSNLSGWAMMPELLPNEVVKPILKGFIFFLFTYAMANCIDDERDLKRVAWAFVLTLVAASVTILLHQSFPEQMIIFTNEKIEKYQSWYGTAPRAVGSLMNPNTAGVILGMATVFATRLFKIAVSSTAKVALIAGVAIMLAGLVYTESRTGALALGIVLVSMTISGRSRAFPAMIILAAIFAVAFRPSFLQDFFSRFAQAIDTVGSVRLGASAQSRVDTWMLYVKTATAQSIVLGQGQIVPISLIGFHAHSSYISALFIHGIAGLCWFVGFFGVLVWRGNAAVRSKLEPFSTLGSAVVWSIAIFFVASFTLDLLVSFNTRFIFFFYAVLVERNYGLLRGQQLLTRNPTS